MASNVIVHSSLPPEVEGQVFSHLYLHIPYIIWNKSFKSPIDDTVHVRVNWWGEKSDGAIFSPSSLESKLDSLPLTVARYDVHCQTSQFSSYLQDMENLNLEVMSINSVLGVAVINISLLSSSCSISDLFPVVSADGKRIAELYVKITLQPMKEFDVTSETNKPQAEKEKDISNVITMRQSEIIKDNPTEGLENADLLMMLLEKAKNLRKAMIISLLQSKNLEKILYKEQISQTDEKNNIEDIIEHVLGFDERRKEKVPISNKYENDTFNSSDSLSSSPHSKITELNESLDSIPDDTALNELFYKDMNVRQESSILQKLQKTCHNMQPLHRYQLTTDKKLQPGYENILPVENPNSFHLFQMKSLMENVKLIKVKVKDLRFILSKRNLKRTTNINVLFQQYRPRTFIVEFIPPFAAKFNSWDYRGHRIQHTDFLKFISRKLKRGVVEFDQEVTIPCNTDISSDALLEKELIFTAKARLHDIKKVVNLGSGSITVKEIVSTGSSAVECSVYLQDNYSIEKKYQKSTSDEQPILCVEVHLVYHKRNSHQSKGSQFLRYSLSNEAENTDKSEEYHTKDINETSNSEIYERTIKNANQNAAGNINNSCISDSGSKTDKISSDLILKEPLHCILQITDGKNFGQRKWIHIVCRLFFSKNSIFRDILYDPEHPSLYFTQIFPILLNEDIIKKTNKNIMVIEVWERDDNVSKQKQLRGLCKLPLHCFYLVFNNPLLAKSHLLSKFPVVSSCGYTPVIHPITNHYSGELNILFALGTLTQIDNMLEQYSEVIPKKTVNDLIPSENTSQEPTEIYKEEESSKAIVQHTIEISVEDLNELEIDRDMLWGEAECYVTYGFPLQEKDKTKVCLYNTDVQLLMPDVKFQHTMQHNFYLKENESLHKFFLTEFASEENENVTAINQHFQVKLWGSFYNPYQRRELIASAQLPLKELCYFLNKNKDVEYSSPVHQSFKLPFQKVFSNSSRLKVKHVKINITYWKNYTEKISNTSVDENVPEIGTLPAENISASDINKNASIETSEKSVSDSAKARIELQGGDNSYIPERDYTCLPFAKKNMRGDNEKGEQNSFRNKTHSPVDETFRLTSFNEKNLIFRAHIFIERALHLPMVVNTERKNIAPSTYVTFNIGNTHEPFITNVAETNCNPVWDWHRNVSFQSAEFTNYGMNLVFRVWYVVNEKASIPDAVRDKVLGFASVDLSPFQHGLSQISGWYNIIDLKGKCRGQIKINIALQKNEIPEQICSNCVNEYDKDSHTALNNSFTMRKETPQLKTSKSLYNPLQYKSLQQHLTDLDVLYSRLMKKLVHLSAPDSQTAGSSSQQSTEVTQKSVDTTKNNLYFDAITDPHILNCSISCHQTRNLNEYIEKEKDHPSFNVLKPPFTDSTINNSAVFPVSPLHYSTSNKESFSDLSTAVHKQIDISTSFYTKCVSLYLSHHRHEQNNDSQQLQMLKEVTGDEVTEDNLSAPDNTQVIPKRTTNEEEQ